MINHLNCLPVALRSDDQTLSRFSSASLLCFGMNPCNRKFEILHQYTLLHSILHIRFEEIHFWNFLCRPESRRLFGRPDFEFSNWLCRFLVALYISFSTGADNNSISFQQNAFVTSIHAQTEVMYQLELRSKFLPTHLRCRVCLLVCWAHVRNATIFFQWNVFDA